MCSNYEPIAKDRIHLLDLFEPTFEYKSHVYPNYEAPWIKGPKIELGCPDGLGIARQGHPFLSLYKDSLNKIS